MSCCILDAGITALGPLWKLSCLPDFGSKSRQHLRQDLLLTCSSPCQQSLNSYCCGYQYGTQLMALSCHVGPPSPADWSIMGYSSNLSKAFMCSVTFLISHNPIQTAGYDLTSHFWNKIIFGGDIFLSAAPKSSPAHLHSSISYFSEKAAIFLQRDITNKLEGKREGRRG